MPSLRRSPQPNTADDKLTSRIQRRIVEPQSKEQRSLFLFSQTRDQSGGQNARFPETAAAIQDQEWVAANPQVQLVDLGIPPKEVARVLLR